MCKTRVLVVVVLAAALAGTAVARPVSQSEAMAVADGFISAVYGPSSEGSCWRYVDVRGEPAVFVCERVRSGGASVTVMVGAKTEMPPVLLYYCGQPLDVTSADQGMTIVRDESGLNDVRQIGSVYYSPLDFWFEYQAGTERVMVSPTNFRIYDPVLVRAADPISYPAELVDRFEKDWQDYLSGRVPFELDAEYWIPDVPDWDWHYGCCPTAAANVLTHWDNNGYDLLVDSVQWLYDPIEFEWDSVPNVSGQLAQAMNTSSGGSTRGDSVAPGIVAVCNDPAWSNDYAFTSYLAGDNHSLLISEINSNRPGVLLMANHPHYINHAVTYCGWGPPNDSFIMIHDEWNSTPVDTVIAYYYGAGPRYVIPVVPGPPLGPDPDMAVASIVQPGDIIYPGSIQPQAYIANLGGSTAACSVFFRIERPGGGFYESFDDTLTFPPTGWHEFHPHPDPGIFDWHCGTAFPYTPPGYATCLREASLSANDDWLITPRVRVRATDTLYFWFRALNSGDMESLQVFVSYGDSSPGSFHQAIQAFDFNDTSYQLGWADFHSVGDTTVYIGFRYAAAALQSGTGICLDDIQLRTVFHADSVRVENPGASELVSFSYWNARNGHYVARCSVYQAGDVNPANDVKTRDFLVVDAPVPPSNWTERASMPQAPSEKTVKRGGWLAYNSGNGLIYAAKGYKTTDFYSYNTAVNTWTHLTGMPYETHSNPRWARKVPRKGSKGIADGGNSIYVTQGNNTLGFWRYDIATNSWTELEDVPIGLTGKKVKGGTDLVYLVRGGTPYVYLLKGYKDEFHRYNVLADAWEDLASPPRGARAKWSKGSWLVAEDENATVLYAHKAKYNELWSYNVLSDSWDAELNGMPFIGMMGRRKKSKDGAGGAWYDGGIYALKGGNTQEFWKYTVAGNAWTELDTLPAIGTTGKKKRVKYGGDIVSIGNAFYALKGNKTLEFWRYSVAAMFARPGERVPQHGVMAAGEPQVVRIGPNPTGGIVRMAGLAGPARIALFDVSGRLVLTRRLTAGSGRLGLRCLNAGVYVLRIEQDGRTSTHRVVIHR